MMKYLNIKDEIDYYKKTYEVKQRIKEIFLNEDYTEIQLSTFEDIEVKKAIYDKKKMESMVKVVNKSSDLLTLRLDNTTGILKRVIPKIDSEIIKLYYDSKVFRKDTTSNIKEIRQMGVECIGGGIETDKEIIFMALDILDNFNGDFILEISNSKYIMGLIEASNLDDEDILRLKELLYTKNRFELKDFLDSIDMEENTKKSIEKVLDLQGSFEEVMEKAKENALNENMKLALREMEVLNDYIEKLGYARFIEYDLSMIMEFSYYDGLIFKGYYPNHYKDIICGGRYDSFTEKFGTPIPAIGFSLDIDELTEIV